MVALPPFASYSVIPIDHVRYIILVSTRIIPLTTFTRIYLLLYVSRSGLFFFPFFCYLFSPSIDQKWNCFTFLEQLCSPFIFTPFHSVKNFSWRTQWRSRKGNRIGVVLTSLRAFMLNVVHNVEQFGASEIYTTINWEMLKKNFQHHSDIEILFSVSLSLPLSPDLCHNWIFV